MRKLASIRKITSLTPIVGADFIELARLDGWNVVVKKGDFKVGDLCIYFEIDSFIPYDVAPFLKTTIKEFEGVKGFVLKTVKLKGVISQGLVIPLTESTNHLEEGTDVSDILGIKKWEVPENYNQGQVSGGFCSLIPKTDSERVQNFSQLKLMEYNDYTFEVTEKIDGESCTIYLPVEEDSIRVFSRNLERKDGENSGFWAVARKYDFEGIFKSLKGSSLGSIAFQGEKTVHSRYGNIGLDYYIFNIFSIKENRYLDCDFVRELCKDFGLKYVPVIYESFKGVDDVDNLLRIATGKSEIAKHTDTVIYLREGLVFKNVSDPSINFKVVSNEYLLNKAVTKSELERITT